MLENREIFVHYRVNYSTRKPVPIPQIVDSLRAYESMIRRTPPMIEAVYRGIEIVETDVFVSKLESGSLLEDFVIRYVFKGQENYENAVGAVDAIMDDNQALQVLVAIGIGAFVGYGIKLARSKDVPSTHIEAHNNTIISIGSDAGLDAESITNILSSVTDKKTLAKEAVAVVRPAKEDSEASIEVPGISGLSLSPEAIADVPAEYEPPKPTIKTEDFSNQLIEIFASDRDKNHTGWAGTIPGIVHNRVPFELWDEVVPSQLHGKTTARADITVIYRLKGSTYKPAKVEVRRVHLKEDRDAMRPPP